MGVLPPSDRDLRKPRQTILRVHGVGGWSSESTLQASEVTQVAGDRLSGFYRRPGPLRAGDPPGSASAARGPVLEAFNWGLYSTQTAIQALWLILLPLAVVNLAGWMIPGRQDNRATEAGPGDQRRPSLSEGTSHGTAGRILRVLGLLLTAELMLGAVGVCVGIIGYELVNPSV